MPATMPAVPKATNGRTAERLENIAHAVSSVHQSAISLKFARGVRVACIRRSYQHDASKLTIETARCWPSVDDWQLPRRTNGLELLCMFALGCESSKMNFSGCCTASLLPLPAIPAKHSRGPDVSLGALVPPFLLEFGPHLWNAARLAIERHVDVVPPLDEVGRSIAVCRAKILGVHQYVLLRQFPFGCRHFPSTLLGDFGFPGTPLDAPAFQYRQAGVAGRLHIEQSILATS